MRKSWNEQRQEGEMYLRTRIEELIKKTEYVIVEVRYDPDFFQNIYVELENEKIKVIYTRDRGDIYMERRSRKTGATLRSMVIQPHYGNQDFELDSMIQATMKNM